MNELPPTPGIKSADPARRARFGRRSLCAALASAGLIGGALILTRSSAHISATAEAMLPYAASIGGPVPGSSLPVAASDSYAFRAAAPTADEAIARADAAAEQAARQDAAAWARAAQTASGSASARLAAMPLARVTALGDETSLRRWTAYRFDGKRAPLAVAWLVFFLIASAGAAWRRQSARGKLVFAFRRAPQGERLSGQETPRIDDLPQMASVRLARDVSALSEFERLAVYPARSSSYSGSGLRPVLSNASEKLWANFASRSDLSSAHDAAQSVIAADPDPAPGAGVELAAYGSAARAVLQQAQAALALGSNTEILFTRLTRDARGSRAAMLAIGRLLAQRGKHVVLVDLDFAGAAEAQAELGLPGDYPGAAEILSRRAQLDDCLLLDDDYPALTAIPACLNGTQISHEQAARLLQSAEMLDLLDELRAGNHLVLIHGPAAEDAARSFGSRADAALLVVGQEPTECEHRALPDALAEMNAVQANIVGRIEFDDQIV